MDLGRDIDELAYLSANPEVDRAQTFLSLMAQMEFAEAEKFLKGEDGMGAGGRLDPDVTYETGRTTAMHMAALNDDVEGVRLLLAYGADREFRDEEGKTALDMARGQDAKAVIALLS